MEFGIIGLGVMGKSLALNFSNKGFKVAVYNIPLPGEESVVNNFVTQYSDHSFFGGQNLVDFVQSLDRPRKVLLMVKSGAPVDSVIEQLLPHLEKGDIIIDGGNSFFKDSIRREKELAAKGLYFVGMGVSGGEKGALLGPSMMPGGSEEIRTQLMPFLQKVAAQAEGNPCVAWIGENGAGHFVKMVHNGIEYADMQLLSESYSILKNVVGLDNEEIAAFLEKWRSSMHSSYLLDITIQILKFKESDQSVLETILDVAGHKGTGLWTVKEALDLGVAIPSISAAMNARILSSRKALRVKLSEKIVASSALAPDKIAMLKEHLPNAILASRLVALAEGFHLMKVASQKYDWNLNLSDIANVWRAGCIIRSKMLPLISDIFERETSIEHLFEASLFQPEMSRLISSLKIVMEVLSNQNVALPALATVLPYYQSMHESYSPINMIQAQRDFFGAHTYKKVGQGEEVFHTRWEG